MGSELLEARDGLLLVPKRIVSGLGSRPNVPIAETCCDVLAIYGEDSAAISSLVLRKAMRSEPPPMTMMSWPLLMLAEARRTAP